jgi:hypothetical protein
LARHYFSAHMLTYQHLKVNLAAHIYSVVLFFFSKYFPLDMQHAPRSIFIFIFTSIYCEKYEKKIFFLKITQKNTQTMWKYTCKIHTPGMKFRIFLSISFLFAQFWHKFGQINSIYSNFFCVFSLPAIENKKNTQRNILVKDLSIWCFGMKWINHKEKY